MPIVFTLLNRNNSLNLSFSLLLLGCIIHLLSLVPCLSCCVATFQFWPFIVNYNFKANKKGYYSILVDF